MATKRKFSYTKQRYKRKIKSFVFLHLEYAKRWCILLSVAILLTLSLQFSYRYFILNEDLKTILGVEVTQAKELDIPEKLVLSYPEETVLQEVALDPVSETQEVLEVSQPVFCDLTFQSYKPSTYFKTIEPTDRFKAAIAGYSCLDQQLLTRIAHYESEFNFDAVNPSNPYATGLFQILPSTRDIECAQKRGITNDFDCALFVIKNFYGWYDIAWPEEYNISFNDLL